jgi:hypothetical protein
MGICALEGVPIRDTSQFIDVVPKDAAIPDIHWIPLAALDVFSYPVEGEMAAIDNVNLR